MIQPFRDRIAILGYGSLIWDLDDLAPHVEGPWAMGAGPAFPLEFSRISPKRLMGLVVCVDPDHGTPCPSHAIASRRATVAEARADLARRERALEAHVGAWSRDGSVVVGKIAPAAAAWCAAVGAAGAVWTELPANFAEIAGRPFDHAAAEAWLIGLEGPSRDEAVRYIRNAPAATDTALRRRLSGLDWWRAEAARVAALDAVG
ncbi:hypothetical protein SAMN05444336_102188 [Albimonas donghaensis]|uniref:Gamma-glutamylcyclotransferase n=1 Tax=Albimonas donghaensis TaxID=356660 RepID=A0A1H2VVX5_9RHOB|nr:hypothetical protein [Albimonas donghaensis]SDW72466.1 hypothetical protein SAMN05444336_102188 [Albimonas donghaensis]